MLCFMLFFLKELRQSVKLNFLLATKREDFFTNLLFRQYGIFISNRVKQGGEVMQRKN